MPILPVRAERVPVGGLAAAVRSFAGAGTAYLEVENHGGSSCGRVPRRQPLEGQQPAESGAGRVDESSLSAHRSRAIGHASVGDWSGKPSPRIGGRVCALDVFSTPVRRGCQDSAIGGHRRRTNDENRDAETRSQPERSNARGVAS